MCFICSFSAKKRKGLCKGLRFLKMFENINIKIKMASSKRGLFVNQNVANFRSDKIFYKQNFLPGIPIFTTETDKTKKK